MCGSFSDKELTSFLYGCLNTCENIYPAITGKNTNQSRTQHTMHDTPLHTIHPLHKQHQTEEKNHEFMYNSGVESVATTTCAYPLCLLCLAHKTQKRLRIHTLHTHIVLPRIFFLQLGGMKLAGQSI